MCTLIMLESRIGDRIVLLINRVEDMVDSRDPLRIVELSAFEKCFVLFKMGVEIADKDIRLIFGKLFEAR